MPDLPTQQQEQADDEHEVDAGKDSAHEKRLVGDRDDCSEAPLCGRRIDRR